MYNTHRGMVPAPNSRLTELLDQLRQEFESQSRNTGEFEHQCECPSFIHTPSLQLCAVALWSFHTVLKSSASLFVDGYRSWVTTFAELFI
jgi:hypothetical protein